MEPLRRFGFFRDQLAEMANGPYTLFADAQATIAALQADNRTYINERHDNMKQIEQLQADLAQRTAELERAEAGYFVAERDLRGMNNKYDELREQNRVLAEALEAAKYELAALFPIPSAPTVHAALEVCGNNNEADARCIYLAYEAICAALTATSQEGQG